jgi:flagellar motor switch protein FliG
MATRQLTGLEKAAVLLKCLPTEAVEKVLKHLSPKNSSLMTSELTKVDRWPDLVDLQAGVLDETIAIMNDAPPAREIREAPATPAPAVEKKTPAAKVDVRIDARPEPAILKLAPTNDANPLQAISRQPPELLALALAGESARTLSLLMNRLDIDLAAEIYKRLPPAKRMEMSMRFATQPVVSDVVLQRIADGVMKKCQSLAASSSAASAGDGGPEKRMAILLRGLERTERTETLTAIEGADAGMAERIKAMLYTFDDIMRIEKSSIQKLLAEIDTKSLALALASAGADIQQRILSNLSKRAQESLKEEIELSGNVPPSKSKQAQQVIVEAIQRLDQRGELVMME